MSKSKKADEPGLNPEEVRYTREALLKSKVLAGFQPDFAAVALTEPTYTIDEARNAIMAVLRKKGV